MKDRSKLSWFLSVLTHTAIAAAIIYAGINYAVPGGEVGEALSIDVSGGGTQVQIPEPPKGELVAKTEQAPPAQPVTTNDKSADVPAVAAQLPTKTEPLKTVQEAPPAQPVDDDGDVPVVAAAPAAPKEKAIPVEELIPEEPPVVMPVEQPAEPEPTKAEVKKEEAPPVPVAAAPVIPDAAPETPDTKPGTPEGAAAPAPKAEDASKTAATGAGGGAGTGTPPVMTTGNTLQAAQVKEIVGNKNPAYPWMSRLKRHEGVAVVSGYLTRNNRFSHIAIVRSSGFADLDKAAVDAYQSWKYQYPGKDTWVIKPFRFSLKN